MSAADSPNGIQVLHELKKSFTFEIEIFEKKGRLRFQFTFDNKVTSTQNHLKY